PPGPPTDDASNSPSHTPTWAAARQPAAGSRAGLRIGAARVHAPAAVTRRSVTRRSAPPERSGPLGTHRRWAIQSGFWVIASPRNSSNATAPVREPGLQACAGFLGHLASPTRLDPVADVHLPRCQ